MRIRRKACWMTFLLLALPWAASAQRVTFCVDVPSSLGGADYLPNQCVKRAGGVYSLGFDGGAHGLGPDFRFSAFAAQSGSQFLFVPAAPCKPGATTFLPRDVVQWNGSAFVLAHSGSALGLEADMRIDALAVHSSGDLLLSFDAPVTVGGNTYTRNDVVRLTGTLFSLFASGGAVLQIPESANLAGLEYSASGFLYLSFATPVALPGLTCQPGDIVRYNGGTYTLFFRDTSFPAEGAMTDFSLPGPPGTVPVDAYTPGTPLRMSKSGSNVQLTWAASCSPAATDFAIYKGTLGSWYSHTRMICSTGGATSATFSPGSGNVYFLVTASDGTYEGSYGRNSAGAERPAGAVPCNGLALDTSPCP